MSRFNTRVMKNKCIGCKINYSDRSYCSDCGKIKSVEYRRTIKGLIGNMYLNQLGRAKIDECKKVDYSKIEFYNWVLKQENFNTVYSNWVSSLYNKKLVPSIDRINDYEGYNFNNIQLTTWGENEKRGNLDRKNGINNKKSKTVYQYNVNGVFVKSYYSITKASKELGVDRKAISNCCNGLSKTSCGFIWRTKQT